MKYNVVFSVDIPTIPTKLYNFLRIANKKPHAVYTCG